MRHTIAIELPDTIEPDGEPWVTDRDRQGTFMMTIKTRPVWQWPEWLTAGYIAMDENSGWFGYLTEPRISNHYWSDGACQIWLGNQATQQWPTSFRPPHCTDWTKSLRRNPRSAKP